MQSGLAPQIERYLDLLSARQRLVASNIANATTPGYKTRDIDFSTEFASAMESAPQIQEVTGLKVRNDGNNVSLDREARLLSENALRFNIATQILKSQAKDLRNAIDEGKSA